MVQALAPAAPAPAPKAPFAPASPAPEAATTAPGSGSARATDVAGDFQTFLKLLTAQLRNQDPLKPLESTEFVAQLASFSAVEQQVATNAKLDSLLDALTGGPGAGLAEWIGREVRAAASAAWDGRPVDLHAEPVAGAELAVLVVRDAATGTEAARLTVDPAKPDLVWAGEGTATPLPPGRYRFEIESYAGGEKIATRSVEVFSEVVEVRRDRLATLLVLADGTQVPADGVKAIRAADPSPSPAPAS